MGLASRVARATSPTMFDFRPDASSDAVNAGTQTTTTAGFLIDSPEGLPGSEPPMRSVKVGPSPRAWDSQVDIGAYEYADQIFTSPYEITR